MATDRERRAATDRAIKRCQVAANWLREPLEEMAKIIAEERDHALWYRLMRQHGRVVDAAVEIDKMMTWLAPRERSR